MTKLSSIYQSINKLLLTACLLLFPVLAFGQADLPAVVEEARQAGIEASTMEEIQNRARQRGLGDEQIVELIRPALDLARQDLPTDMIFKKALEGLSKNVPAARITGVLENIGKATERSAPMVEGWMSKSQITGQLSASSDMAPKAFRNDIISSVARGLMEGVPEEDLTALLNEVSSADVMAKTSPQSIAAAVRIYPELPTTADNPKMSREFIVRSLKSGFNSSELQKLPGAMAVAQRRSQLPAAGVIEGVSKQLKGGVPARQILKNLFNGKVGGGPPGGIPKGLDNKPDNTGNSGNG